MKITILGATGFLGKHLVEQALARGYQVRVLARNPSKLGPLEDRVEVVQGDAFDRYLARMQVDVTALTDLMLDQVTDSSWVRRAPLVATVPVYLGRVPGLLMKWLHALDAHKTPAVCVVVYGNRAYDDALLELRDVLAERGCVPIAGAAFVGEHAFSSAEIPTAEGRPEHVHAAAETSGTIPPYGIACAPDQTAEGSGGHDAVRGSGRVPSPGAPFVPDPPFPAGAGAPWLLHHQGRGGAYRG